MPYLANKRNVAQITNIHYWDSAGGAWSPNLIAAATPYALLPAPVLAGDLIVFGIDTTVVDSGPFCSLVFDIGPAITGVTSIIWRYSSPAPATADPNTWLDFLVGPPIVPFQDNTDQAGLMTGVAFDTSGIASVHWEQPAGWVTWDPSIGGVNIGVTGYWVCADVTTVPGAATPPRQANRNIYSILWPGIEIDGDDVGGDIPALARLGLRCESSDDVVALPEANRIIAGSRSVSRGADFVTHINIADEQNPALIDVVTSGVFLGDVQTPTGWKGQVIIGAAWAEHATIRIFTGLAEQYRGLFHAFLRVDTTVTGVEARLDVALFTGPLGAHENLWFQSRIATLRSATNWEVMDLGRVQIVPDDMDDDDLVNVELRIMLQRLAGGTTMWLYDLILMPVDEWAGEFDMAPSGNLPWGERQTAEILGTVLDIDSVTMPRRALNPVMRNWSTEEFLYRPRSIGRGPFALRPNETQRIYFLIMEDDPSYIQSKFELAGSATMEIVRRYLSMRGDR